MDYQIITTAEGNMNLSEYWTNWKMDQIPDCPYSPNWTLNTVQSQDEKQQSVTFDIFYE